MLSTPPPPSGIVSSSFCVGRDVLCPQRNLGIVCVSVLVGVVPDLRWRCVCVCVVFCCYLDTLCLVGALFIKRGDSLFGKMDLETSSWTKMHVRLFNKIMAVYSVYVFLWKLVYVVRASTTEDVKSTPSNASVGTNRALSLLLRTHPYISNLASHIHATHARMKMNLCRSTN